MAAVEPEGEGAAPAPRTSDLRVRTLSAIVMVAVAGGALWLGGYAWLAFVLLVGVGVLWEWEGLARKLATSIIGRFGWFVGGVVYVGLGVLMLLTLYRMAGPWGPLAPVLMVIATDIGAYFSGRTFGGPKIAPRISPSKTWSGLGGAMLASALVALGLAVLSRWQYCAYMVFSPLAQKAPGSCMSFSALWHEEEIWLWGLLGAAVAVVAQAGDFFESWMKRRAGVKDSGKLIPGHGGLFDRVDGLLAVLAALCILMLASAGNRGMF